MWNSVNNKTLKLVHAAVSTTAKWVKRENLVDVLDAKFVTTVAAGVATGRDSYYSLYHIIYIYVLIV